MVAGEVFILRGTRTAESGSRRGVAVVWLIAVFAIAWGVMQMVGGFDLRRFTKHATA